MSNGKNNELCKYLLILWPQEMFNFQHKNVYKNYTILEHNALVSYPYISYLL